MTVATFFLKAETVVLAVGSRSRKWNPLFAGNLKSISSVIAGPRDGLEAIHEELK
jgi:hypothetical protein